MKQVNSFAQGLKPFLKFVKETKGLISIRQPLASSKSKLKGLTISITGWRPDKEMTEQVEGQGGKFVTTVGSKTSMLVLKDKNSTTEKANKARQFGIPILDLNNFKTNYL